MAAAGLFWAASPLLGLYGRPEIQTVPVARLVANLQRELAATPRDPDIHIRLARLYGMAYFLNADELPVLRGKPDQVWFGYEPNLVPHPVRPGGTIGSRSEAARQYLEKATEHYRTALELEPDSLLARLGYGWTLEQAGSRPEAIAEYRRVIEIAWPKESPSRLAGLGQRFYTSEAAGYLIPLLDPDRDAVEIAELRRRIEHLGRLPRTITPIAVPLSDEATVERIVDPNASVMFDADGSGLRRQWTWISPDAGWLVYDAQGDSQITSALQWFGNVTFWLFWNNGYEALAALDDDGDGELKGNELRYLAIWRDANTDGVSDPGEVRPLADHGIISLSCHFTVGDDVLLAARSEAGVRLRNRRVRPTYDVILRPASLLTAPAP